MATRRTVSQRGGQKVTVTDKDAGLIAFLSKYKGLSRKVVTVGVQGSDASKTPAEYGGKLTLAEVAGVHEFGTEDGRIPERMPLRSTADVMQKEMADKIKKLAEDVLIKPGFRLESALLIIGETFRTAVIKRIRNKEIKQDLAQSTIDRKGSDTALVDDGIMIGSYSVAVRDAKDGIATDGSP